MTIGSRRVRSEFSSLSPTCVVSHSRFLRTTGGSESYQTVPGARILAPEELNLTVIAHGHLWRERSLDGSRIAVLAVVSCSAVFNVAIATTSFSIRSPRKLLISANACDDKASKNKA
jgi:hypothetical protein